jgi:rhamnose utilization protein RhaD (predicted bifunctional aldolase and dehydrogenase)
MPTPPEDLVTLARALGNPANDLAILAEGNVSTHAEEGTFWVKASGYSMREIGPEGFALVHAAPILDALAGPDLSDEAVRALLARTQPLPSVETFLHALLLALPGVAYVGHTHPTALLSLLSVEGSESLAGRRLFPDEVVLCGPAACFVPYADPGLPLARAVRDAVRSFFDEWGEVPKAIWLANHGLICPGASARAVEAATLMSAKAARVWLGALASGRAPQPLTPEQVARIRTRPDEHHRQRLLWKA